MKQKQGTLAEQILALSNPTPVEDADDFWDEDTTAKVADFDEGEEDAVKPSSLRKRTAHRSLEEDSRYKGLRTSRKAWSSLGQEVEDREGFTEDDDEGDDDEGDDDDDDDDDEGNDHDDDHDDDHDEDDEDYDEEEEEEEDDELITDQLKEITKKIKGKRMDVKSSSMEEEGSSGNESDDIDDGEDDDEEQSDDEEEQDDEEDGEDEEEGEDGDIEGFSRVSASEEVEKGKAVQSQLGLWDSFMETRIKLQKALHLSNQLPQCQMLERFLEDDDGELQAVVKQSEKELVRLMQSLITLQDTLLQQNPETIHVFHGETPGNQSMNSTGEDDDDEEIPSDTDDKAEAEKQQVPKPEAKRAARKRKVDPSDFGEHLTKHHKSFESFRNNTIQKWYDKTRLSAGKLNKKSFSGFERSALMQIQQILQDQNRLVQRTQLKRSEFTVLGQRLQEEKKGEDDADETTQDIPETANQHLKNHDPEIFDDDDFYHQLLRELIERRTSSTTDPIQLTRQWLQVQKLRTKVKRQVDTKASKGRKLRYDVHQKLVSFMAPEDTSPMLPEARSELFKSIFGQSISEEESAR